MRSALSAGRASRAQFRAALQAIPERERDGWVDRLFGLEALPSDGPELPRGCVPYLPSSVNAILRMIELTQLRSNDVFVDVGSGLGRTLALTHLLTGADAIGIEIQPELARGSRELASRLKARGISVLEGDAAELVRQIPTGSVFFLYCPFSGDRLERVIDDLGAIARARTIHVCSVDLPLPSRSWLGELLVSGELVVCRSQ
ncbi:MAG TPA: hypothetical protein VHV51_20175 [Polyangiaceae bacterium]|jgi:SAM-dependent methyltransferase|nr:hypothetical protein [Polyangiaceae bacterium]